MYFFTYKSCLDDELGCLMRSLKRVGSTVQKAYGADGLTIACQVRIITLIFNVEQSPSSLFYLGWKSSRTNRPPRSLSHSAPQIPKRPIRR